MKPSVPRAWEELYRLLLEHSLLGVYRRALAGRILDCNDAFARIFGLASREEVLARSTWDLYPANGDRKTYIARLREQYSLTNFEVRGRRRDGQVIWLLENATLLPEEDGAIELVEGIIVDITNRKRAEETLRQSESRYRLAVETAADAFFTISANGKILFVNSAVERIFGHLQEQLLGQDFTLLMPEGRRELFKVGLRRYPEIEEKQLRHKPIELIGLHRDGREIRLEVSFGEYVGENEHAFAAIVRDATGKPRAADSRRAPEERRGPLFEHTLVGAYRCDLDGRILDGNDSYARIFGYASREEVLVRQVGELYPTNGDRKAFLARLCERRNLTGFEARARRKDGKTIWLLENAALLPGEDGAARFVEGSVVDITEQKEAEKEIRYLSGRILRAQDEERRRLARELHDSSAQAATCVAMNLTAVLKLLTRADAQAWQVLNDSLSIIKSLSRELRTMSYLLHPPILDELGLGPALRSFTKGFAERSKLQVRVDVPKNLRRLPEELEITLFRVAQESLTNIHRHSGSKTARLRLVRETNQVTLTVTDRGRGIPCECLEKTANRDPQLGVGIPGMRERVRQLGGQFTIVSDSRGTTVRASLPLPQELR